MKRRKMLSPNTQEPDTLVFHREMYERRLDRFKQRGGFTEREISDKVNNPSLFRRTPEALETDAKKEDDEQAKVKR